LWSLFHPDSYRHHHGYVIINHLKGRLGGLFVVPVTFGNEAKSSGKLPIKKKICEADRLHVYLRSRSASYLPFMRRDIFQAIADPTRRAILVLVALQAMTPNAIAEHFDITRQSISRHLRVLSECDLLAQKQEGREIFYELKIDKMKEIDTWLHQFRKIMEESFKQLDEVLYTIKNKKK
jgi:DNA-binding transcriptional ArsR family regulator